MKRRVLLYLCFIGIFAVMTLVIFIYYNRKEVGFLTQELTLDEVVERFYSNFSVFEEVAIYILGTTGSFDIQTISNEIRVENGKDIITVNKTAIGKQVRLLVYDLGFHYIAKDETGTRVIFQISFIDTSAQGIEYRKPPETDHNNSFIKFTTLDTENWYYYYIPPRG